MADTRTDQNAPGVASPKGQPVAPVQPRKTVVGQNGRISLDVLVPSTVGDTKRIEIRSKFVEKVTELTGLAAGAPQGNLADFLRDEITKPQNMKMPGKRDLMRTRLNGEYITAIDVWLQNQNFNSKLMNYVAVPLAGTDYYCIGENGRIYCYHTFSLINKTTGETFEVKTEDKEKYPICLICIGESDQPGESDQS